MKHYLAMMIGGALCVLGPSSARADCQSELAAHEAGQVPNTGGIAKDGSLAPLQSPVAGQTQPDAPSPGTASSGTGSPDQTASGGVAKDGTKAPLGADPAQAMSGQDAQAQQEGRGTAAEAAQDGPNTAEIEGEKARAIAEAKAALLAGNEEACLNALKKVSGS